MKNSFFLMLLLGASTLFTFTSCDDDDMVLPDNEIPTCITDYVNVHFPNNDIIVEEETDTDTGLLIYEVDLQNNNIDLEFDADCNIIEIDSDTELPASVLQGAIITYVETNYPDQFITGWELMNNEQLIELNNDVDLVFDLEGNFLRIG